MLTTRAVRGITRVTDGPGSCISQAALRQKSWPDTPSCRTIWEDRMRRLKLIACALLAGVTSAAAQQNTDITIVLDEELDLVEPCMATRSNIGRVILQNISETLTELD